MKGLILIVGIALCVSTSSFVTKNDKEITSKEILDKLTLQSDRITECRESKCISSTINKIKNYNSYVIIYKEKRKWIIDRDFENYNKLLRSYKTKSIYVLEGRIRVSEISFADKKYVVILE